MLLVGCKDSGDDSSITLKTGTVMELPSVASQSVTVSFEARSDWTATCVSDWVNISPRKGNAGSNTITVTTAQTNRTKGTRTAQLMITAGQEQRNVSLIQSSKYAIFDKKEYTVGPEGGRVVLTFKSNITESDDLGLMHTIQDWIDWTDQSRLTRAEWEGSVDPLMVSPNTSADGRLALYILALKTNNEQGWMGLDTAFVYQAGIPSTYQSTDFSADGTVTLLQQATVGRGIPFVLMGDGFTDRDVADGTYDQVMNQAMENLFTEEPVRSLRDYFTVYAVTAVSLNQGVGSDCNTVFSTVPSNISSGIEFDQDQVEAYTRKVDGIDMANALSVVIVNSSSHNGVTALLIDDQTNQPQQYAIALCTLIDGVNGETFRQVLVHEAIGHGLAKLADEYGYESSGAPSADDVRRLKAFHQMNWMNNVDTADEVATVLWSSFVVDSRYAAEGIGLYEGAYTYALGVYRPTEESMMRGNQSPFNAPSRKAIYDRVMKLGEGRGASSLDAFAAFDMQHQPQRWNYATSATRSPWSVAHRRLAPPLIIRNPACK